MTEGFYSCELDHSKLTIILNYKTLALLTHWSKSLSIATSLGTHSPFAVCIPLHHLLFPSSAPLSLSTQLWPLPSILFMLCAPPPKTTHQMAPSATACVRWCSCSQQKRHRSASHSAPSGTATAEWTASRCAAATSVARHALHASALPVRESVTSALATTKPSFGSTSACCGTRTRNSSATSTTTTASPCSILGTRLTLGMFQTRRCSTERWSPCWNGWRIRPISRRCFSQNKSWR